MKPIIQVSIKHVKYALGTMAILSFLIAMGKAIL